MTNEIAKELLTTYWSQTTLILAFVAYFGKRIFDNISKKREINHNLFQEKRLQAVSNFFDAYAKVDQLWMTLPHWEILKGSFTSKEIDNKIFPVLNNLQRSVFELQIYFKDQSHTHFASIMDNMWKINNGLSRELFDYDESKIITAKVNNYIEVRDEKSQQNKILLDKCCDIVRKSFK